PYSDRPIPLRTIAELSTFGLHRRKWTGEKTCAIFSPEPIYHSRFRALLEDQAYVPPRLRLRIRVPGNDLRDAGPCARFRGHPLLLYACPAFWLRILKPLLIHFWPCGSYADQAWQQSVLGGLRKTARTPGGL